VNLVFIIRIENVSYSRWRNAKLLTFFHQTNYSKFKPMNTQRRHVCFNLVNFHVLLNDFIICRWTIKTWQKPAFYFRDYNFLPLSAFSSSICRFTLKKNPFNLCVGNDWSINFSFFLLLKNILINFLINRMLIAFKTSNKRKKKIHINKQKKQKGNRMQNKNL
jgi:hypothetical protein